MTTCKHNVKLLKFFYLFLKKFVKRSKKMEKHGAAEAKENWQVRVLPAPR